MSKPREGRLHAVARCQTSYEGTQRRRPVQNTRCSACMQWLLGTGQPPFTAKPNTQSPGESRGHDEPRLTTRGNWTANGSRCATKAAGVITADGAQWPRRKRRTLRARCGQAVAAGLACITQDASIHAYPCATGPLATLGLDGPWRPLTGCPLPWERGAGRAT